MSWSPVPRRAVIRGAVAIAGTGVLGALDAQNAVPASATVGTADAAPADRVRELTEFVTDQSIAAIAVGRDGSCSFSHGDGTVRVERYPREAVSRDVVSVGDAPAGLAFGPLDLRVYVANGGSGTVSVIDTVRGVVQTTVAVGVDPSGVVATSDRSAVYVGVGTSVVRIRTDTDTVDGPPIPVGLRPTRLVVSPDGSRAYAVTSAVPRLAVVSLTSGRLLASVPVPAGPRDVAVTPDGTKVLVTSIVDRSVTILDARTLQPDGPAVPVGSYPGGLVVLPTGDRAFTTAWSDSGPQLYSIDLPTRTVTLPLLTGGGPRRNLANSPFALGVSPDGTTLWASGNFEAGSGSATTVLATGAGAVPTRIWPSQDPALADLAPGGMATWRTEVFTDVRRQQIGVVLMDAPSGAVLRSWTLTESFPKLQHFWTLQTPLPRAGLYRLVFTQPEFPEGESTADLLARSPARVRFAAAPHSPDANKLWGRVQVFDAWTGAGTFVEGVRVRVQLYRDGNWAGSIFTETDRFGYVSFGPLSREVVSGWCRLVLEGDALAADAVSNAIRI